MSKYEIAMEIAGPFAMWSRPDTGASPTSYPIPTWSAVKGIFESIAFFSDGKAWIRPTRVEICKEKNSEGGEVYFQRYTNNYQGPLKDKKKVNYQFSAHILADVCYRIYAVVENGSGQHLKHGNNPSHALQAIFQRRLKKGQCHKTPALGWNEFVPSYWGELRNQDNLSGIQSVIDEQINLDLVSVLSQVFDKAIGGAYAPRFVQAQQALIEKGVFNYDQ